MKVPSVFQLKRSIGIETGVSECHASMPVHYATDFGFYHKDNDTEDLKNKTKLVFLIS
jgi:hypothetical protein